MLYDQNGNWKTGGQISKHFKESIGASGGGYNGDYSILIFPGCIDLSGILFDGIGCFQTGFSFFTVFPDGDPVDFSDPLTNKTGGCRRGSANGRGISYERRFVRF